MALSNLELNDPDVAWEEMGGGLGKVCWSLCMRRRPETVGKVTCAKQTTFGRRGTPATITSN